MKKLFTLASLLLSCFVGCKNKDNQPARAQDDVSAARRFIRSALDGRFDEARTYLLPDSANIQYLDVAALNYNRAPKDTIAAYKSSSIIVYQIDPVNDSTTVVVYYNSFKNDHDTLKVLKVNGQWLVDLKYLYLHDLDTIRLQPSK